MLIYLLNLNGLKISLFKILSVIKFHLINILLVILVWCVLKYQRCTIQHTILKYVHNNNLKEKWFKRDKNVCNTYIFSFSNIRHIISILNYTNINITYSYILVAKNTVVFSNKVYLMLILYILLIWTKIFSDSY